MILKLFLPKKNRTPVVKTLQAMVQANLEEGKTRSNGGGNKKTTIDQKIEGLSRPIKDSTK